MNAEMALQATVTAWLGACAWQDWRKREVSNWLTLPPILAAVLLRLTGMGQGTNQEMLAVILLLGVAWLARVAGGADVKASMAMAILNPALAGWAWMGAIGYYLSLCLAGITVKPFPGMVGFFVGSVAYLIWRWVAWL